MNHFHQASGCSHHAELYRAASDFFFLQNQCYPRSSALEWVGNRYQLTKSDRDFLNRGVFSQETALRRRGRRCSGSSWQGKTLMVDGHNVHITVESALVGFPLVLGNDGALRDLAGRSSRFDLTETSEVAMDLIFALLEELRPGKVVFLFDAPLSRSGQTAEAYRRRLQKLGISGSARAVPVPERELDYLGCVIASSDRAVLDASAEWLDLARWVLDARLSWQPTADFSRLTCSNPRAAHIIEPVDYS